jgi:hypothetical protein
MTDDSTPTKVRKLTVNEKEFVQEMTRIDDDRPRSAVEAYTRVYKNNNSRQTSYSEASQILKRSHIQDAIAVIETKIEADRRRASRGNLVSIQMKLWNIVDRKTTSTYEEIAALKTLASLLPKGALESSPNEDSAASKAELVERLKQVLSDVPDAIDITPESDVQVDAAIIDITSRVEVLDDFVDDEDQGTPEDDEHGDDSTEAEY